MVFGASKVKQNGILSYPVGQDAILSYRKIALEILNKQNPNQHL
jgi:hypothetical protein